MTYIVLNFVLFCTLVWFTFYSIRRLTDTAPSAFIGLVRFLAIQTFFLLIALVFTHYGNTEAAVIFVKIFLCMYTLISSLVLVYSMRFPSSKSNAFDIILIIGLTVAGSVLLLTKVRVFITNLFVGIIVDSDASPVLGIRWHTLFTYINFLVLPGLSMLVLLLKRSATKRRLLRQQMLFSGFAIIGGFASYWLIEYVSTTIVHSFNLIATLSLAFTVYLLYRVLQSKTLYDTKAVLYIVMDFALSYLSFSLLTGIAFGYIMKMRYRKSFTIILIIVTAIILIVRYYIEKIISKKRRIRSSSDWQKFEEDLASLDYEQSPEGLFANLTEIFKSNIQTSMVDFYIDGGEEELVPLFSASEQKVRIKIDNPVFTVAEITKVNVIFRSQINTKNELSSVYGDVEELFRRTNREVMILLFEGSKIFGAIFLGEKHLGNEYTEYDYSLFTRFYSYLFVVGYYFKNIANESVVGTVNREIRMSGQIIESIQSNMDFIDNPKVDVGYLSVAAHNLGGEYIDFIKLTDDRHLMVFGDISGKGINASMSAVILKSIVRTFLSETKDFKQLTSKVNNFIRNNLPKGTFFAGVFALLDFSNTTMYYINCGVPALLMYNQAYNNVIEIQGDGKVLGFAKSVDKLVKVRKIKLTPGDILLTCTDGLLDARSIRGEYFGKDRAQRAILQNLNQPAQKISKILYNQLLDFISTELADDVSIVTIKF